MSESVLDRYPWFFKLFRPANWLEIREEDGCHSLRGFGSAVEVLELKHICLSPETFQDVLSKKIMRGQYFWNSLLLDADGQLVERVWREDLWQKLDVDFEKVRFVVLSDIEASAKTPTVVIYEVQK